MSKLRLRNRASYLSAPGLLVSAFEIRCMPLDDLHCPVRDVPAFAEEVATSIEREGLANPVIVVRGPRVDVVAEMESRGGKPSMLPDTPVINLVMGGTNRVTAAKQLGYTAIDCVLLPTVSLALKLQDLQRGSYSATEAKSVGT